MTRLVVLVGVCPIWESHRLLLSEVDLSPREQLPPGLTLEGRLFLQGVRLPYRPEAIPARMFCSSQWRKEMNLGECEGLLAMGNAAFLHCYSLTAVEIPVGCEDVGLMQTGLRGLDLRHGHPDVVNVSICVRFKETQFALRFACTVEGRGHSWLEVISSG
jgi:hypothetical protein